MTTIAAFLLLASTIINNEFATELNLYLSPNVFEQLDFAMRSPNTKIAAKLLLRLVTGILILVLACLWLLLTAKPALA